MALLLQSLRSMLRPTRSLVVTGFDIVRCPGECNVLKRKSLFVQFLCSFAFALQGAASA
jgi:hypothetical protein